MVHHLLSVSIFCFICATHSPCASHASVGHVEQHRFDGFKDPNIPKLENNPQLNLREKKSSFKISDRYSDANRNANSNIDKSDNLIKRSVNEDSSVGDNSDILRKIFVKYGDGDKITVEGFQKLLNRLDLLQIVSTKLNIVEEGGEEEDDGHHVHNLTEWQLKMAAREVSEQNKTCLNEENVAFLQETSRYGLNRSSFAEACPLLISRLLDDDCVSDKSSDFDVSPPKPTGLDSWVWFYSCLAVFIISICGVGSLIIIPLMRKKFYTPLIQFLVALAVGTLAGDALLHLIPHAMGAHSHRHGSSKNHEHLENTWKGLVAMLGLTFFFVMERLILVAGKWRKKHQKEKKVSHAHVQVYNDKGERRSSTQCMDKYNTSPYCYKDIMNDPHRTFLEPDNSTTALLGSKSDIQLKHPNGPTSEKLDGNHPETELISTPCIEARMLPREPEDYTVIVREHANDHHGHSHKHGHVHAAPQNFSSVAWMVIMGDGLHNFTDGMAIGAAFASGLAGGFSTTVAVFCHELPHELGDFAMLLRAGMSIKQALFYNLLSSGLCLLGNFVGLYLGNTETANQWVFAAAAGTFIYIALVDMIPELSSAHDDENNLLQCILHLSGLLIGVGIMTVIALYEHDLKHLFHETD